jgi:regulatory protein
MPRQKRSAALKKNESELWDYALRALGRRELSTADMRARLIRHAKADADVEAVLARLKEAGYLNDQRFAEHYAELRLEREGHGRQRVFRDLLQRRVTGEIAAKAVASAFQDADEVTLIEQFLARKYRRVDLSLHLKSETNLASVYRRLRYAGFGAANCLKVLRRYTGRAEDLVDMGEGETD